MRGRKTGGRQPGTPNKASAELRAFAQRLLENADYRKKFEARFLAGDLHPKLEEMIWHYAGGKPTVHVEVTGEDGAPVQHVVKFIRPPKSEA